MFKQIVDIRPVATLPVQCVQVDSPTSLYLAGDGMVATHNSTLFSAISLYMLVGDRGPTNDKRPASGRLWRRRGNGHESAVRDFDLPGPLAVRAA